MEAFADLKVAGGDLLEGRLPFLDALGRTSRSPLVNAEAADMLRPLPAEARDERVSIFHQVQSSDELPRQHPVVSS